MIREFMAGLALMSLSATPVLARGPASALSLQSSTAAAEDGREGSALPAILAGTIVVFGILLATETWPFDEDDDNPVSP